MNRPNPSTEVPVLEYNATVFTSPARLSGITFDKQNESYRIFDIRGHLLATLHDNPDVATAEERRHYRFVALTLRKFWRLVSDQGGVQVYRLRYSARTQYEMAYRAARLLVKKQITPYGFYERTWHVDPSIRNDASQHADAARLQFSTLRVQRSMINHYDRQTLRQMAREFYRLHRAL